MSAVVTVNRPDNGLVPLPLLTPSLMPNSKQLDKVSWLGGAPELLHGVLVIPGSQGRE